MLNLRKLFSMNRAILTRAEKRHFFFLSFLFLVVSAFDIVGISAIGYFLMIMMKPSILYHLPVINAIFPKTEPVSHTLILLGMIILVAFLLKTILSCLVQKKLISYCYKIGTRIRIQLMERYLYAPYSYFVSGNTSDMITHILSYTSNYSSANLVSFIIMLVHSIFILILLVFLLVSRPLVTLFLILMFFCVFVIHLVLVKNNLYEAGRKVNLTGRQIVQGVQEALFGLKEVRVLSKEELFLERVREASLINGDANSLILIFQKIPLYFLESVMFIFILSLCLVQLSLGVKVESILALCGVLVTVGIRLLPSLYQISTAIVNIQSSQHSLEEIYYSLFKSNAAFNKESLWPKKTSPISTENKLNDFSVIQFENVSYQYPQTQKYALSSITMTIKRGQSVGIIGVSGAGKSTLIDLLLGLFVPTEGRILLDGNPLPDQGTWVNRFAYIPQTIYLFDATIKQNIAFGVNESLVDQERFQRALKVAQLEEVIKNLPQGVDTIIGENGIKLSGGQRQRIALARAFYHEREIIVMDEATAALDNETEREVVEAIKRLRHTKTLVIIAHRYTTIEHCDVIYRLDQGKIVDSGSYKKVIDKDPGVDDNFILNKI